MTELTSHAHSPASNIVTLCAAGSAQDKAPGLVAQAAGSKPICVNSLELLRGQKTVKINHNGTTYCLQATRLGKLILTK